MAFITTTADNISSGGTITGDLTISGDLTVSGGGDFSYSEVLTGDMKITNSGSTTGLEVQQTGSHYALKLDQDTNNTSLEIDSESTTANIINVAAPVANAGHIINIESADALTTGSAIRVDSGGTALASTATGGLVEILHTGDSDSNVNNLLYIINDDAGSTGTTCLKIQQDSTGPALVAMGDVVSGHSTAQVLNSFTAKVQSIGTDASSGFTAARFSANDGSAKLNFAKSRHGSAGSHTIVADNDTLGDINFTASDGTDFGTLPVRIRAEVDDSSPASSSIGGALTFATAAGASSDDLAERMRIDKSGNVGIGTSAPSTLAGNSWTDIELQVKGTSGGGAMAVSGATQAMLFLSDEDASSNAKVYGIASVGDVFRIDAWNDNESLKGTRLTINASGNVGIAEGAGLYFDGISNTYIASTSSDVLKFYTNDSSRMVLDNDSRISLSNNDSGTSNTIFGKNAGDSDGAADLNVFIGELAGGTGTQTDDADSNVGIGYRALTDLTEGTHNIAIGKDSATNILGGDMNIAIGGDTLYTSTAAIHSIAIGKNAMYAGTASSSTGSIAIGYDSLRNVSSGVGNIAVGYQSGYALTTGEKNTAVGYTALAAQVTGDQNTAIGYGALYANATADGSGNNTAVGFTAGKLITSGLNNTIIGSTAFDAANAGESSNVAIGYGSMGAVDETVNSGAGVHSADHNISIGENSLTGGALGGGDVSDSTDRRLNYNIAIGSNTLNSTGQNASIGQIAIGYDALTALTSGAGNTAVGYESITSITGAQQNTVIGYQAGRLLDHNDANNNVAIGYQSMLSAGTGNTAANNVAVGASSLLAITTGGNNIAIGSSAGDRLTTVSDAIFIGRVAGRAVTTTATGRDGTVAIGSSALTALTTGVGNLAVGYKAGLSVIDADANTAIGYEAFNLIAHANADNNTAIGYQAMKSSGTAANNDAASNTAVGTSALLAITDGDNNVAVGVSAASALTAGSENTAIGMNALAGLGSSNYCTAVGYNCLGQSNGNSNSGLGLQAMYSLTSGASNTAIGYRAGRYYGASTGALATANSCVYLGYESRGNADSMTNEIVIGANAVGAGGSNTVTIGDDNITAVYMAEDGATGTGATVYAKSLDLSANSGGGHPHAYMQNHVADSEGATFQFRKSRNTTVGSHTIVQNNDQLGNIAWYASDGNSYERGGVIQCLIDGTPGDGDIPTEMLFGVAADGETTSTTRLTIAPAGTVSGDLNDTSDVGLKENIKTIEAGLTIVNQFNPVTFDWKQGSRGSNSGFIAQEIEKILPNDVCGKDYIEPEEGEQAENMGKSINVTGIVAHLVKAVQELSAKVEALENKG